jgi:AmmeMemoRadiSam system protein B
VATEQGWDARQFLDAVCLKAGLPAGAWQRREAELMLFDGVHFGAALHLHDSITAPPPRHVSQAECALICQWVRSNLRAIREGATPMDSAAGVGDLEVLGLTLSIRHRRAGHQQWMQLGIREQRPLQSSLSQMTEQAARWLGPHSPDEAEIDVAVFHDCVHHGSAAEADVRGVDGRQHAIVNTDGRRWSLCFRPQATVEETLAEAGRMEAFRGGTQVYSMHCSGGGNGVAVSTGPRPASRVSLRPPAVAGRFYPADDGQREAEVDRCLEGREPGSPQPAVAAMVPHAALRFSGRIAADVWRRLRMPRRVLIIGPKHTTEGVDWAVAPHDRWQISDRDHLVGDIEMAWQLAEAIPGMQLDARAHAEEHGIEVQLPLLHRLCPDVQLAAIAMHGGSIAELELAADGLAAWMASQAEPPLLVVSSDMNHFADDAENRRRDRLALDALAGGDGARLLGVCQQENISMCGRVPAVLALMVMQRWGRRVPAREIGYATSADSGADPGRVVGYAGVIWGE